MGRIILWADRNTRRSRDRTCVYGNRNRQADIEQGRRAFSGIILAFTIASLSPQVIDTCGRPAPQRGEGF
jgi:hypothetical protein